MIKRILQAIRNWYKGTVKDCLRVQRSRNENLHKSKVIKRGWEWPE